MTVVSNRIVGSLNRSGATRAVALDISKVFDKMYHADLLHELTSNEILGQKFGNISSVLSNRQLQVVLHEKSSQEYSVNAKVPQGSILGCTLFLLYINDLPDDFISSIAIYTDDATLYSECNKASDLWQQLELKLKGCVLCIFASLFLGLNGNTCQIKKNVFYFTSKPLFNLENQILEFYIFKFHGVIKCLSIKQEIHFTE